VNSYRYEEPGRRGNPPVERSEDVSPSRIQQRETARWEKNSEEFEEEVKTYRYDDEQVNLTCPTCIIIIITIYLGFDQSS